MTPMNHQLAGAKFLAPRKHALLADAPRVGKTGAAIIAADYVSAQRVLVVTTASGRPVWQAAFPAWSLDPRPASIFDPRSVAGQRQWADRLIVGWPSLPAHAAALAARRWDLLIVDESHYAKNVAAKRTRALYDTLAPAADRVWCLTGTPIPNAPNDLFPMMRALFPERLDGVETYDAFLKRYCIVKKRHLSRWNSIDVVVGGRNLDELAQRLDGVWLRRTQQDVGITAPIYELLPILLTPAQRARVEASVEDAEAILDAAETGETRSLEHNLGTLRRLTGGIKAEGVITAVQDELAGGLDKIVLMAWHHDVLDALALGLQRVECARIDGSSSADDRRRAQADFARPDGPRVFLGQITACGEAIDLSAAADLIFVESSWVPKDMAQAALRITNHGQRRQPRVRVAALQGSIDEALQGVLLRKVATNREVIQ